MSVSKPWLDAGCISAAPTGCVSDSECAAARRCLLRPQVERLPPNPHEIGLQAATRALVGTFGPHHSRQMTERAVAAYLSALAAAGYVVERGWQPIETAPRDGAPIWAWNGEYCQMEWFASDEWSGWLHCDPLLSDADPDPVQPTHWRPLPAPPAAKEPQG